MRRLLPARQGVWRQEFVDDFASLFLCCRLVNRSEAGFLKFRRVDFGNFPGQIQYEINLLEFALDVLEFFQVLRLFPESVDDQVGVKLMDAFETVLDIGKTHHQKTFMLDELRHIDPVASHGIDHENGFEFFQSFFVGLLFHRFIISQGGFFPNSRGIFPFSLTFLPAL